MSMTVGGVNLVESALNNELEILVLKRLVDHLATQLPDGVNADLVEGFRREAIETLQKKYPNAGIRRTPESE